MTYEELLDKWIRKLGRPCTAGEFVQDLRHLERPRNLYYEQLQKESDGELVAVVRCKECKWHEEIHGWYRCLWWHNVTEPEVFCSMGERREDGTL